MPAHYSLIKLLIYLFPVLILSSCSKDAPSTEAAPLPQRVKMLKLGTLDDQNIRVFPGVVVSRDQTTLAFRVSGQLEQVNVVSGEKVKKGDILASIDKTDFELRLAAGEANYHLTKVNFERSEKLVKDKLISEVQYDSDRSKKEVAEITLEQLRAEVDYTTLRAPFDGTISRTHVKNFEWVNSKQPILNIQTNELVEVEFQAAESLISQLNRSNSKSLIPKVRFEQFDSTVYESVVSKFDTQPDPNTLSYTITLVLPKPPGLSVFAGMSAEVLIDPSEMIEELANSYFVPLSAMSNKSPKVGEQVKIWLFDPDTSTAKSQMAVVSFINNDRYRLKSDFSFGDKVIISGIGELKDGLLVTEWTRERGL